MKLLIVGTGRSGTGYISAALNWTGVRCGHESVYDHEVAADKADPRWDGYDAEASWLATPYVTSHDGPYVWQLRHPADVIDSLDRLGLFRVETDDGHGPFRDAIRNHVPGVFDPPNPLTRAARFVTEWSALIPGDAHRYAVETLDADQLTELADLAGHDVADYAARVALVETPRSTNAIARRRSREEAVAAIGNTVPGPILRRLDSLYGDFYPRIW